MKKTVISCDICKKEIITREGERYFTFILPHVNYEGELCRDCYHAFSGCICGKAKIVKLLPSEGDNENAN